VVLNQAGQEEQVVLVHGELHQTKTRVEALHKAFVGDVCFQGSFVQSNQEVLLGLVDLLRYVDLNCLELGRELALSRSTSSAVALLQAAA